MDFINQIKKLAGIEDTNHKIVNGYRIRGREQFHPTNSMLRGFAYSTRFAMKESVDKEWLIEAKSWGFPDDRRGGIIVLSTDVNAVLDEPEPVDVSGAVKRNGMLKRMKDKLKSKITSFAKTWNNRLTKGDKVSDTAKKINKNQNGDDDIIQGLSIGNLFKGRYINPQTGKVYDEKSFTVEVVGISSDRLLEFATELSRSFDQMEVMVKDLSSGEIYFADRN